ncbi:spore germination protein [Lysinibacillus sphaericus OT4b.31]|uniref:Spore germination protein n=1 Tax=Lysinibacillus sphaericus OT4b.31 TaxID=1285586 RepID=R7ZDI3_LYSSH|nr:spore germination protein [Lysinibacillus sphaericus OT4b.31]
MIFIAYQNFYRKNVSVWKKSETNSKITLTEDSISKINVHVHKINPGRKTFDETLDK